MTVKSLSEVQKDRIVTYFTTKTTIYSQPKSAVINEMAILFERHRRTIIRVLEERRIDTGVKPRTKKPEKPAVKVVIPTRTPWYRRIFQTLTLGLVG